MDVGFIFGLLAAIIIIGLLLAFGVQYIGDMNRLQCDSQTGQIVIDIREAIEKVRTFSQGSVVELKLLVPGCKDRICFVDPSNPEVENKGDKWVPDEFLISFVQSGGYNVLIINPDGTVDGESISNLAPYVNFCIESSKSLNIKNLGRRVEISLPEN
jgi:type II secretory pathway pseudopilin PulG